MFQSFINKTQTWGRHLDQPHIKELFTVNPMELQYLPRWKLEYFSLNNSTNMAVQSGVKLPYFPQEPHLKGQSIVQQGPRDLSRSVVDPNIVHQQVGQVGQQRINKFRPIPFPIMPSFPEICRLYTFRTHALKLLNAPSANANGQQAPTCSLLKPVIKAPTSLGIEPHQNMEELVPPVEKR